MQKDEVFKEQTLAADFKFSKKVADVFDDMVKFCRRWDLLIYL